MLLSYSSQVLSGWEQDLCSFFPPKTEYDFLSFTNKLQVSQIQAPRKISLFSLLASLMFKHHNLLYQKSLILNLSAAKSFWLCILPMCWRNVIFHVVTLGNAESVS